MDDPDLVPTPANPNRAWVAREVNKYIRELAERLRDERPIGYFCECGCMGTAAATVSQYDAKGGAWIEGHSRHCRDSPA